MERTKENGYGLLADPMTCTHPTESRMAPCIGHGRVLVICKACGAHQAAGLAPRPPRQPRDPGTSSARSDP